MPELPEIANLAGQLQADVTGNVVTDVEVLQPKCLNLSPADFEEAVVGARIEDADHHGKWIRIQIDRGWLLLNLGMGGEVLLATRQTLPEKYRVIFDFADDQCLVLNFWWFGYVHYAAPDELLNHKMTAKLGPNALDVDAAWLQEHLGGRRGRIKNYLLNQAEIAGIGNFYVHDILFQAGLHPLRPANTLGAEEFAALADAIHARLGLALEVSGADYELDLHGQKGGFTREDYLVAYREGEPCPVCGTAIEKSDVGSTSSFLCPSCQPLLQG
jgi:formamidopyrimidine-DNA glycosylase